MDRLAFADLIAARLCHDLAGPIGALANGAELLADETDEAVRAEFVAMMGAGATTLAAKLRFMRLLFGGGGELRVPVDEARTALADYLAIDGRVVLDWPGAQPPLARPLARLLLALALIAADALGRSGRVTIRHGPGGWTVRASGPQVRLGTQDLAVLRGTMGSSGGSRAAAAYVAAALAADIGARIGIVEEAGEARLSVGA